MKAATNNYVFTDIIENISIHAAREGGDDGSEIHYDSMKISIHAAREGGDSFRCVSRCCRGISIHAAREGGDERTPRTQAGRTAISIHAAREGGDHVGWICGKLGRISIHAAREGGDGVRAVATAITMGFQSTPPVKAATPAKVMYCWTARFQSTPPVKAATRTPRISGGSD